MFYFLSLQREREERRGREREEGENPGERLSVLLVVNQLTQEMNHT